MPIASLFEGRSFEPKKNPKSAWETSRLGKVLRVLGTGERLGTKYLLRPFAEAAYPDAAARIQALQGDVYAGDIIRAVNPDISPLAAGVGGVVLGGAVDPSSYVTLGGLTRLGRGIPMFESALKGSEMGSTALRGASLAEQAAKSQRDLVRLTLPWSNEGPTLIRGTGVYKAADLIRGGKLARTVASKIAPSSVALSEVAKSLDTFANSVTRKFNAPFGMNPWLYERSKWLWASIQGHQKFRGENDLVPIANSMRDFAAAASGTLNIPYEEAFENTRGVVRDVLEAHPTIGKRLDFDPVPKGKGKYQFEIRPALEPDELLVESIRKNFNLPANVSSNAHPLDTQLQRQAKKLWGEARSRIINADEYQARNLHNFVRLWSDSGDYLSHLETPELLAEMGRNAPELVPKLVGLETGARPTSKQLQRYTRHLRVVDPTNLEKFIQEGRIPQFIKMQVRGKDKGVSKFVKYNFDLHKSLRKGSGRIMTPAMFSAVQHGIEKGLIDYDVVSNIFKPLGISEANDLIYKYGITSGRKVLVAPGTVQKAFHDDPLQLITRRGAQAERNVLSNQFYDEIKSRADKQVERMALGDPNYADIAINEAHKGTKGFEHTKDWVPIPDIPELRGYLFDPDAAKHLARMGHSDVYINEHLYNFLDKVVMKPTKWLKNWTLSIFPSYHIRNWVTNSWQYYMGETHNPSSLTSGLTDSFQFMVDHLGHGKDYMIPGTKMKASELKEALTKRNALGIGFIASEDAPNFYKQVANHGGLDGVLKSEYKKNGWVKRWKGILPPPDVAEKLKHGDLFSRTLGKDSEFTRIGFKIGEYTDNHIRIAHVLNRLREGYNIDNAIMSMKKYFFDYHDLSPAERNVFKYIFPFYTWSRKNIPFQLEALIREPGRLARFHGFLQGFTGNQNPIEEEFTPDYFRKNFGVRVRKNSKGQYEYFMLKNWISVADLQELAHIWEFTTNSLNPLARVPLELLSNTNFFTDQKIDKLNGTLFGGGERQKYLGIPRMPNKMAHIMSSFRPTNTVHNLLDNPQDLDVAAKISSQFIGRQYPLDVVRGQYTLITAINEARDAMYASIRSAQRRNAPPDEIERLIRMGTENIIKAREGIGPQLRKP